MISNRNNTCIKCGNPIVAGVSEIAWSRKPRLDGLRGAAWHVDCAWKPDNRDLVAKLLTEQRERKDNLQPFPQPNPQPTESKSVPTTTVHENGDFLAGMAGALAPYLDGKLTTNLDAINARVDATLAGLEPKLESMIATATKTITVDNRRTGETIEVGKQHEKFPKLLSLLSCGMDVYLHGEPGTGKSSAAEYAAKALGLQFGYISLTVQTSESRVVGYKDAHGNYVETEFYKRYIEGGVFLIDEIDAASGNLLTGLNSALANGNGAFPCGQVKRHPDFICIATGNTTGFGHNPLFPERQVLSGAIRDRFAFLHWSYDLQFERELALAQHENKERTGKWVTWVQQVRAYAARYDTKLPVTPRASIKGATLLEEFTPAECAEMLVFRGYDKDSVSRILAKHPLPVL